MADSDMGDPSVVPLAALILSVLSFVFTPINNTSVRTHGKHHGKIGGHLDCRTLMVCRSRSGKRSQQQEVRAIMKCYGAHPCGHVSGRSNAARLTARGAR